MSTDISFCPLCAGKLDAGDDEQFVCVECETHFLIEVVSEDDEDVEDDKDEDEDDDRGEPDKDEEY